MKKLLIWFVLFTSIQANAAVISLVPSASDVYVGENISLDVVMSELAPGGGPSLGAFDLNLNFMNSLLNVDTKDLDGDGIFDSVILDPDSQLDIFNAGLNFLGSEMVLPGMLRLFDLSLDLPFDLDANQSNSFTLARVQMTAMQAGASDLSVVVNALSDAVGNSLGFTTKSIQVTVNSSTTPISEPNLWSLMTIVILITLRRRKVASR